MRSPPPIPRLRRDLTIAVTADATVITDPARGRQSRFEGPAFGELVHLLRGPGPSRPSQAELSRHLQLPRLRVQTMVQDLLAVHAFVTPRSVEQARIHRVFRAFRRARRTPLEHLTPVEWLGPADRGGIRRVLGHALAQSPERFPCWRAVSVVATQLAERHQRFELHEIFATRDAFHIIRPDPEEAPDFLHRLIDACGVAALELPTPWRDAVHRVLGGVDPRPGPRLPRPIIRAYLHQTGIFRGFDRLAATAYLFLLQRILTTAPALAADDPAFVAWTTRHRDRLRVLFAVQGAVFIGAGPPALLPPSWAIPGLVTV